MRILKVLFIIVIFSVSVFSMTGLELAKKLDEKDKPKDSKSNTTMILTNKNGKTQSKTIRSIQKDDNKKQIIWFLSPARDKGVAFLKLEHKNRDDEMSLWLPAFKKIRKIRTSDKGDSFMGSDMSYEDMTTRDLDEYNYELLDDENLNGTDCFVLKSKAKPKAKSTYKYIISWIDKTKLTIVKEKFYDNNNKLHKVKTVKFKKIDGYETPTEFLVKDVQKNHKTKVKITDIELDTNVKDDLFQEKNLKRAPR
ncbi:MAG: outer membrane lipoprotein-sorting protein [Candidatus Marinimicrobia bacterium]|nr:outer membrane lipoprotein-sorting protein [Candidatus Neomarinimicrobiota bacterium]